MKFNQVITKIRQNKYATSSLLRADAASGVLISPPPMPNPSPILVDRLKKSLLLFSESCTCISCSALLIASDVQVLHEQFCIWELSILRCFISFKSQGRKLKSFFVFVVAFLLR